MNLACINQSSDTGYLMINSLHISNYRCFKNVRLEGLRRINVIVGASGSGKTALLEALFICGGSSPELFFKTQHWRGMPEPVPAQIQFTEGSNTFQDIWKEMFFGMNPSEEIRISFTGGSSKLQSTEARTLKIYYDQSEEGKVIKAGRAGEPVHSIVSPLVFEPGFPF